MLPHLVFDLDGTLIDSVPQVAVAVNATLRETGRQALPLDDIRKIVGDGAHVTMERALAVTGGAGNIPIATIVDRYLAHYLADPTSQTQIFSGVLDVLEQYLGAGALMGICTNKPRATTHPVLASLKLDRYFSAVITADDTQHRKPSGRHVLETLAAMGGSPHRAVFVGDSATDLAAAQDARLPAILVDHGFGLAGTHDLTCAYRITHFSDLPAIVETILRHRGMG